MTLIDRMWQFGMALFLTAGVFMCAAIIVGALPYRQRTVWEYRRVGCPPAAVGEAQSIECSQNRQSFEPVYVPWAVWR